jgi:formyl-CoA transferase
MNLQILEGVKVVDLTSVVLGPYATQIMGDMGADVIKVETPDGGDVLRHGSPRKGAMGSAFLSLNRNKRSLALDVKSPQGRAALLKIISTADVFVHNMRQAAAAKLGLDYPTLSAVNPRLVYCAAWGFGSNGPYAGKPAFDDIIQSLSGTAALQGKVRGKPGFMPTALVDKITGLSAAYAAAMGLFHRERTGCGVSFEVPMFEAMVSFLFVEHIGGAAYLGDSRGAGHPRQLIERGPFATLDGLVAIMPYTGKQWRRFYEVAGRPDLARDARVADDVLRNENIDLMMEWVAGIAAERTTAYWVALLEENDIPVAATNGLDEVLEDPHLKAVGLIQEHLHPAEGPLRVVGPPVLVDGQRPAVRRMVPRLGEHTREILAEAGLDTAEVERLVAAGIAAEPPPA